MSVLAYITGTLIAPNIAGYLLSKGLTKREKKILIDEIEAIVTEFNRKFDDTEVDSNYFVEFLEQKQIVDTIIQRVFNSYITSKEDYEVISKKLALEAVDFVNIKKEKFKHTQVKKISNFEEYFSELFDILVNFRESLLGIEEKAVLSIVDESIVKSAGNVIKTFEDKFSKLERLKSLENVERILIRIEELNQEYKTAFIPLDHGFIKRKEFSMLKEVIDSGNSLIIHGKAGRGKSGCTVDIINYL